MSKVICLLYPDPVDGYPKSYVRDDLPKLTHYPGGQTLPTPKKSTSVPACRIVVGKVASDERLKGVWVFCTPGSLRPQNVVLQSPPHTQD
jgi:formate dehydrogenase